MIEYRNGSNIKREQLELLYDSVGWIAYTKDLKGLEQALINSLYVVSAWHGEQLVGLIRVIGDGYTILYIQDILIHPDYQRQKIGTTLMSDVLATYKHVRQKVLLTVDKPDVRGFYESFGLESCDKGSTVAFYKEY
ncbi:MULTISPECIES: GNAT family N-acetyltransferase [unclassified Vagococcus]|uniref:GNAT family N-acetyltransferase n=1 Tax=unclassified Vagococcus TaxID=2648499 RepID=UPI001F513021|nr:MULTISPECIES: GNAT family N-acetyltransferase [unclassified Vagococcus]MCI0131410.1 GNAT family N-acetyltransferase [Vagococcus sp. CY53-2]UNM89605.1 GNAT family N-acetyltransferase [Vagococcus sp. CY52-2]